MAAGSAELPRVPEDEQPGGQAEDAVEEPRDPNLGLIRFKASKLLGKPPQATGLSAMQTLTEHHQWAARDTRPLMSWDCPYLGGLDHKVDAHAETVILTPLC